MTDDDSVLLRKVDHPFEKLFAGGRGRGVVRVVEKHELCFTRHVRRNGGKIRKVVIGLRQRHHVRDATRKTRPDRIDRVARSRHEYDITGIHNGQWHMADSFLGTDQREDFGPGV